MGIPENHKSCSSSDDHRADKGEHPEAPSISLTANPLGVVLVESVLSRSECARLVVATAAQDSLDGEYSSSERNSTRLLVESPELATVLWERLQPTLTSITCVWPERVPMGFGVEGKWRPAAINPCFRISTYQPRSQGFKPHRDSAFVTAPGERSLLTLIIYLTGQEEYATQSKKPVVHSVHARGCTDFFISDGITTSGLVRDEKLTHSLCVSPVLGRAVLFPHSIVHAGSPLSDGCPAKIVLRTDIVYRRVQPDRLSLCAPKSNWRYSPQYIAAVEMFQRAFKMELAGRVDEASQCYERCNAMRVNASSALQLLVIQTSTNRSGNSITNIRSHAQHLYCDMLRLLISIFVAGVRGRCRCNMSPLARFPSRRACVRTPVHVHSHLDSEHGITFAEVKIATWRSPQETMCRESLPFAASSWR